MQTPTNAPPNLAAGPDSRVIHFKDMHQRSMPNGGQSFDVLRGKTATGDAVNVHETTQPGGATPNPAHAIEHTEIFCLYEGTMEIHFDGRVERMEPGDVMLIAKGTVHQVRNAGAGPASYFVVAIGGDALGKAETGSKA